MKKAVSFAVILALAGVTVLRIRSRDIREEQNAPINTRLLSDHVNATASHAPEPRVMSSRRNAMVEGRGAWDFTGPELHATNQLELSSSISAEELSTVESAWRAGHYEAAARAVMQWRNFHDRRQILLPLLGAWAFAEPSEAAQFAGRLPTGVERRELVETVVRTWAAIDPAAASIWLNALGVDSDNDGAVAAMATSSGLMEHQPRVALS